MVERIYNLIFSMRQAQGGAKDVPGVETSQGETGISLR